MPSRICLFLLILFLSSCDVKDLSIPPQAELSEDDRTSTTLLPLPYSITKGAGEYELNNNINWHFEGPADHVLQQAFSSMSDYFNDLRLPKGNGSWEIYINTSQAAPQHPYNGMNESYDLEISSGKIIISAENGIGIERGMRTLRQLIKSQQEQRVVPECRIYDIPQYPWRGLMIDVSRHFITKEVILQNIEALATAKMNVLHLHLTDDQGWRVESKVFPKLHEVGSNGDFYTQNDIIEIVDFASSRGVRIVPEFDLPGHASALLAAYPEYGSRKEGGYNIQSAYGVYPASINPVNQDFYLFYAALIKEMITLFPDAYIHIGSDEVVSKDWENNSDILNFMESKQLNGSKDLQTYFNLRISDVLRRAGKKMIAWDEALHPELIKSDLTIQAWRTHDIVNEAIVNNTPAILSTGWYLDHKKSAGEMYLINPKEAKDAVHVNPDPDNWIAYELSSPHPLITQKGILFLFGPKENMRGLISLMDRNSSFDRATIEDGQLFFDYISATGEVNAHFDVNGDQIEGNLNISFIGIPMTGKKIGAHDMEGGMMLPTFKKPAIPTLAQAEKILGGEACMWSEWVDNKTINSRIWPRTLAIAEKLWSPIEWTTDVDDLYRRIDAVTPEFEEIGVIDDSYQLRVISRWSQNPLELKEIYKLTQLLEEVKQYSRWSFHLNQTIETPLDRVADIVAPESIISRKFNLLVEDYLIERKDEQLKEINKSVQSWIPLYGNLKGLFSRQSKLQEVEFLALALSDLAKVAERKIDQGQFNAEEVKHYEKLKKEAQLGRGGVLLPCASGLISFIENYDL